MAIEMAEPPHDGFFRSYPLEPERFRRCVWPNGATSADRWLPAAERLRILDATTFLPEITAPVCVIHYRWGGGDLEPYFWAQSVEMLA
jgi:hypothetical protein